MIKTIIDATVTICDCCGKKNLLRTIKIENDDNSALNLGVTCAGKRFNLNLSGNPYQAAVRLEEYINKMSEDDYLEILEEIKDDSIEWF